MTGAVKAGTLKTMMSADAVRHTHVDAGVGVGTRNVGCTLQQRATGFGKRLTMTNYLCTGNVINCI